MVVSRAQSRVRDYVAKVKDTRQLLAGPSVALNTEAAARFIKHATARTAPAAAPGADADADGAADAKKAKKAKKSKKDKAPHA